jgi:hypothetical protein
LTMVEHDKDVGPSKHLRMRPVRAVAIAASPLSAK